MENREFYYSVEPIMKDVSAEEYVDFINNYPRKLMRDVFAACDPPSVTYNDFELADRYPYSVVACTHLWSDDPEDYFYTPMEERIFRIMENIEEVFASRTGNKTED